MRVLVIVAHPDTGSLNHALASETTDVLRQGGHHVIYHALYQEGFDPLLPAGEIPRDGRVDPAVEQHCRELASADGIVIVHPNWWGQPPAILKGWVDRVFRPGVAYEFLEGDCGDGIPVGLLNVRAALVFNTSNTPERREQAAFGDPLETLWRNCIFGLCGVTHFERRTYGVVCTSTLDDRRAWLADARALVARTFPVER